MNKKRILVFLLLLAIFAVSFLILTFDVFGEEKPPRVYSISLIVRGKSSDSWESIRQGADQAASEMHVDLSFITLSEQNNLGEQIALIEREYDSGVDALIIAAADSAGLSETVELMAEKLPIICIESTVDSPSVSSYITADNYEMGQRLGREILSSGNARKRLAIVYSGMGCTNIRERLEGLMSVLGPIGGRINRWLIPDSTAEAPAMLADYLAKKEVDVAVTLDISALELTAQAAADASASYLDLFGIGSTGKVASFIEQDVVTGTIVQNDFGIGYLGVKAAVDALQKKPVAKQTIVENRVINLSNMYDLDNQRLLFPFIR